MSALSCYGCNRSWPGSHQPQFNADGERVCPGCGSEFVEEQAAPAPPPLPPPSHAHGVFRTPNGHSVEVHMTTSTVPVGAEMFSALMGGALGGGMTLPNGMGMQVLQVDQFGNPTSAMLSGVIPGSGTFNMGDYATGESMDAILTRLMNAYQPRAQPTPQDVLDRLPRVRVPEAGDTSQEGVVCGEPCTVCHDAFCTNDELLQLGCKHAFHPDCILPWLKDHSTCPVCRASLYPPGASGRTQSSSRSSGTTTGNAPTTRLRARRTFAPADPFVDPLAHLAATPPADAANAATASSSATAGNNTNTSTSSTSSNTNSFMRGFLSGARGTGAPAAAASFPSPSAAHPTPASTSTSTAAAAAAAAPHAAGAATTSTSTTTAGRATNAAAAGAAPSLQMTRAAFADMLREMIPADAPLHEQVQAAIDALSPREEVVAEAEESDGGDGAMRPPARRVRRVEHGQDAAALANHAGPTPSVADAATAADAAAATSRAPARGAAPGGLTQSSSSPPEAATTAPAAASSSSSSLSARQQPQLAASSISGSGSGSGLVTGTRRAAAPIALPTSRAGAAARTRAPAAAAASLGVKQQPLSPIGAILRVATAPVRWIVSGVCAVLGLGRNRS